MPLKDRLRHTITIERRAGTGDEDDWGQSQSTWSVLAADVPAWVQPLTIRERAEASEAGIVATTMRVYMMPRDITTKDRLRWNGEILAVDEVLDPANRGKHLELMVHGLS